jgi:hypothetical protein
MAYKLKTQTGDQSYTSIISKRDEKGRLYLQRRRE